MGCSLFAYPNFMIYYQRHTQNFRRNRDGVGKKWLSAYKSSNISETRQDMTKVLLRSNRKSHTAFDWCQSQRPRMTSKRDLRS